MLYLHSEHSCRLALKLFRGEPAITEFGKPFTPTHSSSEDFSTYNWFGPPSRVTETSSWPWVAHSASGPPQATYSRISHSLSLRLHRVNDLTSPPTVSRGLIMQKACGHPASGTTTVCRHMISGSISLPYQGFFSPFPHGTSTLSVISEYLALGGGPPGFRQGFTCPALLGIPLGSVPDFVYGSITLYGRTFQNFPLSFQIPCQGPATPSRKRDGLGCSPFARHYLGNRICFPLLRVLRCFTSPGVASQPYVFRL